MQLADLGLVVIDEQHRFGVEHRTRLRDKRRDGRSPDILVMTATPIPRSLALTVYGDLDVTVLRERPGADTFAMRTLVLPTASPRRAKLYDFVRDEVAAGHRCYVVCPLVEGSDALEDVADVETVHARLTKEFPGTRIGLVHGRLPAAQREAVMEEFRSGAAPILVTTTVVEVGVDVGEATVMLIEDADRFGISQLHQLRGRLYRGLGAGDGITNFCVLFTVRPRGQLAAGSRRSQPRRLRAGRGRPAPARRGQPLRRPPVRPRRPAHRPPGPRCRAHRPDPHRRPRAGRVRPGPGRPPPPA